MTGRRASLQPAIVWIAVVALTTLLVAAALASSVQISIVILGLLVGCFLGGRRRVVVFAVTLVPTLSLLRRLVAGETGYTEGDPLILLPLALTAGVLIASLTQPRTDKRLRVSQVFILAVVAGVAGTVILTGSFSVEGLFFAGLIIVPLLLAVALATGQLPPVWDAVVRVLPTLGIVVGTYGIYQFFVLPNWDRAWMRSSLLTSIGHPFPLQVRVFGASESPGPYALFIGLVITLCLASAVTAQGGIRRFGWIALGAYLAFPLLLSGVRSVLLGVAICAVVLALVRARGFTRILLVAFLGGAYYLLTVVLSRFGTGSTILTADRYTSFSANDDSLVARLNLLGSVGNPFAYVVGRPVESAADNLFVDTLVRYGLLAAVALLVLIISIIALALRQLRAHLNEAAALCAIFIASQTLFGPTFNALFGILIGVVFGTVMANHSTARPRPRDDRGTRTAVSERAHPGDQRPDQKPAVRYNFGRSNH
ncbi:hypothetical protein [Microbacterium sp. Clip185]|uniref:hypothetical protein n=1 Tax=Microbacterium sp. Clip185 TaxID=3025663 RepID=UPI0023651D24|nr:hypothetical protein [Microbacterium sp. Clip185]WDG18738.1 hypothetical protein PQV94_03095 [Microbacterium sp. Clip185]